MVLYMNGSLNSLGLLDLKWIIIIRMTGVTSKYRESYVLSSETCK